MPPQLPPLHQGMMDASALDDLFEDLATCTEIIEIRTKSAARAMSEDGACSLQTCRDALGAGTLRAAQIRYRYDADEWWDTFMRTTEGWRVTRLRLADAAEE